MFTRLRLLSVLASLTLAACSGTSPDAPREEVQTGEILSVAPPGAPPGSCWAKDASPAVVETVTEQILVQPAELAEDGRVIRPAVYRTETHQAIVTPRQDRVFETPCPDAMTAEFIASLQRALSARALYRGPISGMMDGRTRAAIRRYQKQQGLDSAILSLEAARSLGLVALERPEPES